jgi:carbon-monoxide dehydrogenase small subunit
MTTDGLHAIRLVINETSYQMRVPARKLLVDALREECGLTGTHIGCEHGVCGACTIQVDGKPVRSCLIFAVQADGCAIRTVEGLAQGDQLHPLQTAFIEKFGFQCAFCTSGFLMTAEAFLRENPDPTEAEVRDAISGNICRCTGYSDIIQSVQAAAGQMRKEREEGKA